MGQEELGEVADFDVGDAGIGFADVEETGFVANREGVIG
jgi:hypothetical protein